MKSAVLVGFFCALAFSPAAAQTLYIATPLGSLPGSSVTIGNALNMSGQVVGTVAGMAAGPNNPYQLGFLYSNGVLSVPSYGMVLANGINNSGEIVGYCYGSSIFTNQGCIYHNGTLTDLAGTWCWGINNTGQATGTVGSPEHAFIYTNGQIVDLGTLPGTTASTGYAINDAGQVAGVSGSEAFLYTNGVMVDLGINGMGTALNNAGQVVGVDYSSNHAFLYSNGVEQDLGTLPGASYGSSIAYGINNRGQIVGSSGNAMGYNGHAFVYDKGVMTDLNSVIVNSVNGITLGTALAINDFGQIVANGPLGGGPDSSDGYPFLLTPLTRLRFVPVPPCRVVDTRNPPGPFGGPEMLGGTTRDFTISSSACGIPSTAVAYSLNVTVVPDAQLGYLTIWPSGIAQPLVSTLNSDGRVKANAAIVRSGYNGAVSVFVTDPTQLIVDINGYFEEESTSASDLQFYPLAPCRIADTRQSPGPFGAPFLQGGSPGRPFPVPSSACNIPAPARAYSLNFTAVPHGPLGYLTVWPTGQPQPLVSTLNASTGVATANAAIVPAGANGAISVYASNDTDLVIDINGYFAPPGSGGLDLFTVAPCRVLDTRNPPGSPPFSGPLVTNVAGSNCLPVSGAQVFVLNASVVPAGPLGYLTLWPDGAPQPLVSTLNAPDGAITSNMAIVPSTNGSIDAFASDPTWLIYDLLGYFAP